MIWHVIDLQRSSAKNITISEALDTRVDVLRKTTLYDGRHPAGQLDPPNQPWESLKSKLESIVAPHIHSDDTTEAEEQCWDLLAPLIYPKLEEEVKALEDANSGPYECWRPNVKTGDSGYIELHFDNVYRPSSPFKSTQCVRLRQKLLDMIDDLAESAPKVTKISCLSWLNEFEPFLRVFPPAWKSTFIPVNDFYGTAGWWGQYVDHKGVFHHENATKFRRLRHHPYAAGRCYCNTEELKSHLRSKL